MSAADLDGFDAEVSLSAFESFDRYDFETGECEYFDGWTRPGV
jgi:hypothetical protein